MNRSTVVRGSIFLATVVAASAVLSLGTGEASGYEVGMPAPQDFFADREATGVLDAAATEAAELEARASVDENDARELQPQIQQSVESQIAEVFDDAAQYVVGDATGVTQPETPSLPTTTTSTTAADDGSTTTTQPAVPALLTGLVFLDLNGDGLYDEGTPEAGGDVPRAGVTVEIATSDDTFTVTTGADGTWQQEVFGPAVVTVDAADPGLPDSFMPSNANLALLVECEGGETCPVEPAGFAANVRPVGEAMELMSASLTDTTRQYLLETAAADITRVAMGQASHLENARAAAFTQLSSEWGRLITEDDLQDAKQRLLTSPPTVVQPDGLDPEGGEAVGEILSEYLQANYLVNEALLADMQDQAAEDVPDVTQDYSQDQLIVGFGEPMTELHIAAIDATSAPSLEQQPSTGLMAVVAVLVALIGLYLATFRPEFWARPRMAALFGIMIVLAAGSVRGTVALSESFSWYVLPAVAFGFVAAVLFDQRIGILMAMAVGVLTAVGTLDTGVTVYATLAALAPIPFVSAVSSRGSFRNAIVLASLVAAGVAASTSWFFHVGANESTWEVIGISVAWAFGVSVLSSLVGLAALQFFESAFDVTTTLGLLDLTDRNHKALQMLQEKAFGTFNHSLMVGTLSDAAARAIGANALLARAMAYYHDLGKTEHPTYFIENQFGISNPHDELDPKESAEIIRQHVTAGVALARQYKIPTDVTEGIVSHHGDGVMRFFYEKARQEYGVDVDIDDFRHIGHKPRTAESAILMLSDSLEAACRAIFQSEEPTPSAIEKVVDRIMDEKLEDGQLSESPLTLGEISKIRQAFLDSLIGHYHQRIAYPNFPGS